MRLETRIAAAVALTATALPFAGPASAVVDLPDSFTNQVVVSGLDLPTSMAFLQDGRVLFTEQKTGKVRMVVNGHIAATDPVLVVPSLATSGYERGLQGIAVDPGWPQRPFVYLFYNRNDSRNILVRYTATGDIANPAGENIGLTNRLLIIDNIPDNDPNHQAGCLRFGPDGHLFVSLGEDEDWCAAKDSTSLKGQFLRLNVTSLPAGPGGPVPRALIIPSGNPFAVADSNAAMVWAYGFRNPWRFHIDPWDSTIVAADVGEADFEEMNEVVKGGYFGWPYREGGHLYVRANCPEPGGPGTGSFDPPFVSLPRGAELTAINSAGIYRPAAGGSANWPPQYSGDLFWSEYYTGIVRRMERSGGSWVAAPPVAGQPNANDWGTGFISAVDFARAPDGSVWWLRQSDDEFNSLTGALSRIRFTGQVPASVEPGSVALAFQGVWPNPASGFLGVSFSLPGGGPARLSVYDLAGRLRLERDLSGLGAGSHVVRLPASGLNAGVYLVRIESAGRVVSGKTVVAR